MLNVFRRLTVPYQLTHWSANLTAAIPQIIGGFILVFYWAPSKIGLPWSNNGLALFEISPEFVGLIEKFGDSFADMPFTIAYIFAVIELLTGIILMIGCCIRIFSFFFILQLVFILIFREFDGSWSYIPYFSYISICLMALYFGSGKFGVDYLIAKGMKWL